MTRQDRLAVPLAVLIFVAVPSLAEVIRGTATITCFPWCPYTSFGTAIDVSTGAIVDRDAPAGDLSISAPVNYCWLTNLWFSNGGYGRFVGGALEEVMTAPEPTTHWVMVMPPLNEACVLKTIDGLYVKFAVRALRGDADPREADIEYYVQTDGTPVFGPTVPVASTTWGKVKALYR